MGCGRGALQAIVRLVYSLYIVLLSAALGIVFTLCSQYINVLLYIALVNSLVIWLQFQMCNFQTYLVIDILKTGIQKALLPPGEQLSQIWQMGWVFIRENCHVRNKLASLESVLEVIIGSDNGLALKRCQAIIWSNVDQDLWCHMMSTGYNVSKPFPNIILYNSNQLIFNGNNWKKKSCQESFIFMVFYSCWAHFLFVKQCTVTWITRNWQ